MSMQSIFLLFLVSAVAAVPVAKHSDVPTKFIGRDVHGHAVRLPMQGLGTWQYNNTVAGAAVKIAFSELNYVHLDTAYDYENQKGIGDALKASGRKRNSYFITTKIPGGLNASTARANFASDLKDLQMDYVDLLLVHFPATMDAAASGGKAGRQAEWKVMEEFYHSGQARAIGVSHYCKQHLNDIIEIATVKPMVNQVQFHVGMGAPTTDSVNATDDKDWDGQHGVVYEAFSSLCGPCGTSELVNGSLVSKIAAKYTSGLNGSPITGAQVSLRWVVQQGIPVIPKTDNKEFLQQNIDLFSWKLSDEDMATLTAATSPAVAGGPAGPPATSGDCSIA